MHVLGHKYRVDLGLFLAQVRFLREARSMRRANADLRGMVVRHGRYNNSIVREEGDRGPIVWCLRAASPLCV